MHILHLQHIPIPASHILSPHLFHWSWPLYWTVQLCNLSLSKVYGIYLLVP